MARFRPKLKNTDFAGVDLLSKLGEPARCYQLRSLNNPVPPPSPGSDLKLWLHPSPSRPDDDALIANLTYQQIEKTLAYFLLCSERVDQMTKTYNDIEAITRLLEEKEKDLELAAKIGQSLLEQNREIQQRNEFLEEQLSMSNDHVLELKAEVQRKVSLLHVYAEAENESNASPVATPKSERKTMQSDFMDRKIRSLEDENTNLKYEAVHLKNLTQGLEDKERQLVADCVHQLEDANQRIDLLHDELSNKSEECSDQQSEVTRLLKEIVNTQTNERVVRTQNDDMTMRLYAAQETQSELSREIIELQERYSEVMAMLSEAQEELRTSRRRPTPYRPDSPDSMYESLASELEASDSGFLATPLVSARDSAIDSGTDPQRAGRTIRLVRSALRKLDAPQATIQEDPTSPDLSIPRLSLADDHSRSPSPLFDETVSFSIDSPSPCDPPKHSSSREIVASTPALLSHAPSTDSLCNYEGPRIGEPGMPGTRDLEYAIRRLSMRRQVEMQYQKFRRERGYSAAPTNLSPIVSDRPSTSSTASNAPKKQSTATPRTHHTPRVQIFKPLEGSRTLNQWRKLASPAQPSLVGAIESAEHRSGVKTRTELAAVPSTSCTAADDYMPQTCSTYTLVTSTVRQPEPSIVTSPSRTLGSTTGLARALRASATTVLTGAIRAPSMSTMMLASQEKGLQLINSEQSLHGAGQTGILTRARLSAVDSTETLD